MGQMGTAKSPMQQPKIQYKFLVYYMLIYMPGKYILVAYLCCII
jgi:hypothetical protein